MKTTGIVRRVDDLGRLILPKEIRRALKIEEGSPIEIYLDEDKIVLKKYLVFEEIFQEKAKTLVKTLSHQFNTPLLICSLDKFVAGGKIVKNFINNRLPANVEELLRLGNSGFVDIQMGELTVSYVCPIISDNNIIGEVIGGILLLNNYWGKPFTSRRNKIFS